MREQATRSRRRWFALLGCAALLIGIVVCLLGPEAEEREKRADSISVSHDEPEESKEAASEALGDEPLVAVRSSSIEPPVRSAVEADFRVALPPHVMERLARSDESVEDYERYLRQERETRRIVSSLAVHRFFMKLRSSRFDASCFVSERWQPNFLLSDHQRRSAIELLAPICATFVSERRAIWKDKKLDRGGNRGFVRLAERNLVEREAWLALESQLADEIREVDSRLRDVVGRRSTLLEK